MKVLKAASFLSAFVAVRAEFELATSNQLATSNPLATVLKLMEDLHRRVAADGEVEARGYRKYSSWCKETTGNAQYAVKTSSDQKTKLEAKIDSLTSDIMVAGSKIDKLSSSIAKAESELTEATQIREKEQAEFQTAEKELSESVDTVSRALFVLEKETSKNPASLAQVDTTNMRHAIQTISVVLDAASFSNNDQKKLMALVQSQESADEDLSAEIDQLAASKMKSKSSGGGIVEVLEDMKDKADSQLTDLRSAEVEAKHNFKMLQSSLKAQLGADKKDMEDERTAKSEATEEKADAEGELDMAVHDLKNGNKQLETAQGTCLEVAADYENIVRSRDAELKVIAKAQRILQKTADEGAASSSASAASAASSFLQVSAGAGAQTRTRSKVTAMIRKLAQEQHSAALAQLASGISVVLKAHGNGRDPFVKIKGMLRDMITKLNKEATNQAEEKAYCDGQMMKTEAKKSDLEDITTKLTSKIDSAAARSAELKEDIKELEAELASLTKEQAEIDKIRQEEHADFETSKADLEQGLGGVRKCLRVLEDYYGSASLLQKSAQEPDQQQDEEQEGQEQDGNFDSFMQQPARPDTLHTKDRAGNTIIVMLENIESGFAQNLAKEESQESDAQSAYDKTSSDNKVSKTSKEQDVKYKTQETKSLDTTLAELSSDSETSNAELAAVNEYYARLKGRCVAKPDSYEERKKRREAEITGLKEALATLKEEAALVQRSRRGNFRGSTLSAR